MYSHKRKFGNIGEKIVSGYLCQNGYSILSRNYLKKYGEIDIVARKDDIVHFLEVKTVSREMVKGVAHETWRAEENVHPQKLKRLHRVIEVWISEHGYQGEWEVDIAIVLIDQKNKTGKLGFIRNIT